MYNYIKIYIVLRFDVSVDDRRTTPPPLVRGLGGRRLVLHVPLDYALRNDLVAELVPVIGQTSGYGAVVPVLATVPDSVLKLGDHVLLPLRQVERRTSSSAAHLFERVPCVQVNHGVVRLRFWYLDRGNVHYWIPVHVEAERERVVRVGVTVVARGGRVADRYAVTVVHRLHQKPGHRLWGHCNISERSHIIRCII